MQVAIVILWALDGWVDHFIRHTLITSPSLAHLAFIPKLFAAACIALRNVLSVVKESPISIIEKILFHLPFEVGGGISLSILIIVFLLFRCCYLKQPDIRLQPLSRRILND